MSILFKRIKDWATSITAFRTGDVIPVDGPSGTAKMTKDNLLNETAQNALNSSQNLPNSATIDDLIYTNFFSISGPQGPKKVAASIIQNIMQSNASKFVSTRTENDPYKVGEFVTNWGRFYRCIVEHYGDWNSNHFREINSAGTFTPYNRVSDVCYALKNNYHFSITDGNKVDTSVNTSVYSISEIHRSRPICIENDGIYGVRMAFLTSDPTALPSGSAVDFCLGSDVVVIPNKVSKLVDIPSDCQFIVLWVSTSFNQNYVKFYSPYNTPLKNERVIHPVGFWYDTQHLVGETVRTGTAHDYILVKYDISNISEFYINYNCKFPSNFDGYPAAVITDAANIIIDIIDDSIVKESNGFALKLKNKKYSNSFITSDLSNPNGVKYLWVTYKVVDNDSSFVLVTTSPIEENQKCFRKLVSTYLPGRFLYDGSYINNWRTCVDEFNVVGLKEVLIEHGLSIASSGPYEFLFQLSDNTYTHVFIRRSFYKYDSKLLVPVPSNAVKLIVHSSLNTSKKPYHRTKVYEYCGGNYGDASFEDVNKEVKTLDIMFIGNSLTQDAVSYLPLLLKEVCPDIEFNIYMWYNGGYTLKRQWEDKIDPNVDAACEIFSICHTDIAWVNSSIKMTALFPYMYIDYLVLQEYFNYVESYSATDTQYFNNIVNYIAANSSSPFEVDCLFHAPKRGDNFESIYTMTKNGNIVILKNTPAVDIFVPGCAIYEACGTSLDALGDLGHLSPDGTHAQEGLPCLLEAYVMLLQILNKLGRPITIEGVTSVVDASNYASINVPGPNLGTGVVVGTADDYKVAKQVAASSTNKKFAIMGETF